MKSHLSTFVCTLALAAAILTSCGRATHEALADQSLDVMNQMVTTIEGVKDEASAEAAADKLDSLSKRMETIAEQMKSLGDPSDEVKKKLAEKMGAKSVELSQRMMTAVMAAPAKAQAALRAAMMKFQKSMSTMGQ